MKSSAWIWRITASVSVIVTIVLILGFVYAFKDINDPQGQPLLTGGGSEASEEKTAPEKPESAPLQSVLPNDLKVAAIGDSLAKGTGDNTGAVLSAEAWIN